MSLERDLKQAFERHAGDVRPSTDPLSGASTRLVRSRRRRAAGYTLAVAAIAAVLGVGLPKLVGTRRTQIIKPGPTPTQPAGTATGVQEVQLFAPGQGWIIQNGNVYRTADDGKTWHPVSTDGEAKTAFANGHALWTVRAQTPVSGPLPDRLVINRIDLLQEGCPRGSLAQPCYANTASLVETPPAPDGAYGPMSISFVDDAHGWLYVDLGGGSGAVHPSLLFATSDGGVNWHTLSGAPPASPETGHVGIVFFDSATGFVANGADLYRTADAGRTWRRVVTAWTPRGCGGATPVWGVPALFPASRTSIAPLSFTCPNGSAFDDVAASYDEGTTWVPSGEFNVSHNTSSSALILSAPTDHIWFAWPGDGPLYFTRSAGTKWSRLDAPSQEVLKLSFVDATHGWLIGLPPLCNGVTTTCTLVYSTTTGGRAWSQVPPPSVGQQNPLPAGPTCTASALTLSLLDQAESGGARIALTISVADQKSSCVLSQLPVDVRFVASDGSRMDIDYQGGVTPTPILLNSSTAGTLNVWWGNWCGKAPGRLRAQVILSGGTGTVSTGLVTLPYVPRCDDASHRSTVTVIDGWSAPANGF